MATVELAVALAVMLTVLSIAWLLAPAPDKVKDRLRSIREGDVPVPDAAPVAPRTAASWKALVDRLGAVLAGARREPTAAIRPATPSRAVLPLLMVKVGLMATLPVVTGIAFALAGWLQTPWALLAMLASAPVGLFAPNVFLAAREAGRKDRIRRSLPDVLDLLVICVEAGMSLNTAFRRVAEKIRPASPALADEFLQLHREIQAGRSREEALRAMGERSGVDELRSLAAMMVQTDRMGTSIAKALRIHADAIREKFHHEAEGRAARATVKLAFPLVLCIFPALLVVIVGPAAVRIFEAFATLEK